MNLAKLLTGLLRGNGSSHPERLANRDAAEPLLFGAPRRPADIRLSPGTDGLKATASPRNARRVRRSWFGWLWGRNRRRDASSRLVQGELLLTQVRPIRNDFRETDDHSVRARAKVLYETPPAPERRDDQDHAWNRLRNRRTTSLVVSGE